MPCFRRSRLNTSRRLGPAGLHVSEAALQRLNRLYSIEQVLVGFRILDHDFRPPVDGQDERVSSAFEAIE